MVPRTFPEGTKTARDAADAIGYPVVVKLHGDAIAHTTERGLVRLGLADGPALVVALGFMLGAFGQIPINDYMVGKMASGAFRARIYGVRYVVSFTVLAATLPLIGFVYETWGFDTLFYILATAAFVILAAVSVLPRRLPTPAAAAAA